MIVRQVSFSIAPGSSRESFEFFWNKEYRIAMARQPGFVSARLFRFADEPYAYQMQLEFESEEASAAWRASADHENLKLRFKTFVPTSLLKVLTPAE
jgi:heme-degrading monooxygenase HmoA